MSKQKGKSKAAMPEEKVMAPEENPEVDTPQTEDQAQETAAEHSPTDPADQDTAEAPSHATEELEQQVAEWKDKYLRLSAEFDNYRKRTLREKQDLIKVASADTLLQLLPVVDDFDRALESLKTSESIEGFREGLELIHKSLLDFLKRSGVELIKTEGLPLDTDYHDAITTIPAPDKKQKGKIVDVIKKGYLLNGAVLRHAQVVIGE